MPVGCQKRHAETLSPFPLGSASPSCRPGHSLPPETIPWVCLFRRRLLFPVSHSASLVTGASRRLGGVGDRLVCEGDVWSRRGPSRAWRPCSGAVGSRSLLRASFSALTFLPSCPLCPFWTPSPGPALAPIWWLLWCVASVLLWPPLQICHRQRLPFSQSRRVPSAWCALAPSGIFFLLTYPLPLHWLLSTSVLSCPVSVHSHQSLCDESLGMAASVSAPPLSPQPLNSLDGFCLVSSNSSPRSRPASLSLCPENTRALSVLPLAAGCASRPKAPLS